MKRSRHKIKQKRSLSQVFLNDNWPCQKLTDILSGLGVTSVIEIGPGGGILTGELLERNLRVLAVEKDDRFAEQLQERYSQSNAEEVSLEISNQDILSFDLEKWILSSGETKAVCGNIPYAISTKILNWSLPHISQLKGLAFLVQLEFAKRVAALPGSKDYGSLSVYCQLRARAKLEFTVSRTCFTPVPKVDSAVISLKPPREPISEFWLKKVEVLTRTAFMQRRKKLSNALGPLIRKQGFEEKDLPVDFSLRAENLSPLQYLELAKALYSEAD